MSTKELKLVRVADNQAIPLIADLLVGRAEECGLRITQGLPSRRHAQVSLAGGAVWVEDLGSSNGTYVNGERIESKTKLNSGDRLRFDVEEFDFHAEADEDASDKTEYRKPPEREPAKQQVVAEASGIIKRPGAWADPDSEDGGASKTKFMDPATLKAMIAKSPQTDAPLADKVDAPHLAVITGSGGGSIIKLQGGIAGAMEWTIGSGAEREVVFVDSGVSSLHAKIVNEGTRWKLLDQMSANGTFVNGKRSNVSFLSDGDRVRFGPVECEFKLPVALAGSRPSPRAPTPAPTTTDQPARSASGKRNVIILISVVCAALIAWGLLR